MWMQGSWRGRRTGGVQGALGWVGVRSNTTLGPGALCVWGVGESKQRGMTAHTDAVQLCLYACRPSCLPACAAQAKDKVVKAVEKALKDLKDDAKKNGELYLKAIKKGLEKVCVDTIKKSYEFLRAGAAGVVQPAGVGSGHVGDQPASQPLLVDRNRSPCRAVLDIITPPTKLLPAACRVTTTSARSVRAWSA